MKNIESKLVEQFENEILNWLNSENENGTYIAAILVKIAKQEFLKLNEPAVINWVAVADRLPEENKNVICWNGHRMIENSWMQYTGSDREWFERTFTHWTGDVKPPCL